MSWSITKVGTRQDLTGAFDTDPQQPYIPFEVREAIRHLIMAVGGNVKSKFETYGHIGPDGTGNLMVKVDPVKVDPVKVDPVKVDPVKVDPGTT
jgi:hypothetical protein